MVMDSASTSVEQNCYNYEPAKNLLNSDTMAAIKTAESCINAYRYKIDETERRILASNLLNFLAIYGSLNDINAETLFASEDDIKIFKEGKLYTQIYLKCMNGHNEQNGFFKLVNQNLENGGYLICCLETLKSRSKRISRKYPSIVSCPLCLVDFIFQRVFPKLKPTRKLYYLVTGGRNKAMSWTEIMGRLAAGGFELVECRDLDNMTFIVSKKVKEPVNIEAENSGLFIKLKRVGKDGKFIYVYKFRTMHPYAEFLQDYAYQINGTKDGDKIENDFRVTRWGRILRKYWIDEQPMWINLLLGQLKLVGVRPLSEHKLSLYPEELRIRRLKYKPGLFPPYYADLPKTNEEFFACENKYLDAYESNPLLTDLRYFLTIFYNIFFKRARSA